MRHEHPELTDSSRERQGGNSGRLRSGPNLSRGLKKLVICRPSEHHVRLGSDRILCGRGAGMPESQSKQRWWLEHDLCNGTFKGGGAKGVAYAGALEEFESHRRWFKAVAGASAGAITAALIAAGVHPRGARAADKRSAAEHRCRRQSLEGVASNHGASRNIRRNFSFKGPGTLA